MTHNYTMKIDEIPGELELDHAKQEHAVQNVAYSFRGAEYTPNTHAGITGRPVCEYFAVHLPTSKAIALLVGRLFTAKQIPSVRITLWTLSNGQTVKAEAYTLTDVSVGRFETAESDSAGASRKMTFNFQKLTVEGFAPGGEVTSSMTYDFVKATAK